MTDLDTWHHDTFSHEGLIRERYCKGEGPGVVIVHEIPGITPRVIEFAEDVVAAGFTVVMPLLVGKPGKAPSLGYGASSLVRVCVAREFTTWALNKTSPVIDWLRALARDLHAQRGGPGVGALGMCFSGGFALGMMVDEVVVAPVLSQPSMPFPVGKRRAADLNLAPADLDRVKARVEAGCEVLGLRFSGDRAVGTRFDTLRRELGNGFVAVELPSSAPRDHSVLTEQRDEPSVQRVIEFFRERLLS